MGGSDPPPPDPRARLRAAIAAFPGQRFAVVDGGHFDDLPALLRRERLFGRSLFLDQADIEVQKAGPWLVALAQAPEATDQVMAIVGDKPAAVFWSCESGEAVLHRHLRTINMARIPTWAADGKTAPGPADPPEASRPVLFRHFDPRVLGALLPCLDAAQGARFLGPAEEAAFVSADFGGLRRLLAGGRPPAPRGMLTLRSEQIDALMARQDGAREARMMAYLRATAPQETGAMSDDALRALVRRYAESGARVGLTHERSRSIWCFLMVASNGRFEHLPKVRAYLRTGPGEPDDKVETLLHQMVRLAESDQEVT